MQFGQFGDDPKVRIIASCAQVLIPQGSIVAEFLMLAVAVAPVSASPWNPSEAFIQRMFFLASVSKEWG